MSPVEDIQAESGVRAVDYDSLKHWVGRTEQAEDIAVASPLARLAATLDHTEPPWHAGEVPPLGHWLYCLPRTQQRDMAEEGHAKRGGFIPPVPLPRRMWAGGRLTFHSPFRVGEQLKRISTITAVQPKTGRSGTLVFVTVQHELSTASGKGLTEVQDIVYREAPAPGKAAAPPPASAPLGAADWVRAIHADPVMLFRYSALTFNAHRIHYDRGYCREEGYPGLVVHGPLTATLLMDLFLRHHPGARVTSFAFRGRRPLFDIHPFTVCGKGRTGGAALWALDHEGQVAMTAELEAL
jgi:3-methylfumaryl-CoA hydratase